METVEHHFAPHLYAKEMRLPAGHYANTHVHKDAHFSFLGAGSVFVEVDGVEELYEAPMLITIAAGKKHKITAITNVTWYCIHATDETDVDKIDEVLIRRT